MTDPWTTQLSRYVDREISDIERVELEQHLESCDECRRTIAELQQVSAWAQNYDGRPPHPRVWRGIAAAIRTPPLRVIDGGAVETAMRRRRAFHVPSALAAGVALLIVSAGSFWLARATAPGLAPATIAVTWEPAVVPVSGSTLLAAQRYAAAVAQFEAALLGGELALDTATISVLRQKLAIIDRAIDEARQAVADDPNSGYLVQHFNRMMKQKLALLRHTARVVTAS